MSRDYFHGTNEHVVSQIVREGFKSWILYEGECLDEGEEPHRYPQRGNLGIGTYVSEDWRTAAWYGNTLLRVELVSGTRILSLGEPPESKVLRFLVKEFGQAVLDAPIQRAVPRNKQLTLPELVALVRYHYHAMWDRIPERSRGRTEWPARRMCHWRLFLACRSMLVRYGYHGFGDLQGENGIVIFAPDRIILREIVGLLFSGTEDLTERGLTLSELRRIFVDGHSGKYPLSDRDRESIEHLRTLADVVQQRTLRPVREVLASVGKTSKR